MALHIIAPTFHPDVVGGAGTALAELTSRFIRELPDTRVYLNEAAAAMFPDWRQSIIPIACGSMTNPALKALAVGRLELFGFPEFPRDGVCWFPFGPMMPVSFRGNGISTIHDTLEKDLPRRVPLSERIFRRVVLPRTVRTVDLVTVSEFSARRIKEHYGVSARVIRWGLTDMPAGSDARVPEQPYAFYPANAFLHKNHRFLLEVWQRTPKLSSIALVFTLGHGLGQLSAAISEARRVGINVVVTGRVTRAELAGLYRNARCALLPSLYEGFGLPIQEALLCDCPIIANANCAALRETVTPLYPYFLPLDHQIWADNILAGPRESTAGVAHYLIRRTWENCVSDYLEVFDEAGRRSAAR
jgi:glycosyltransferase involved in cell wall biosynthesis